ncbi:hypothetical protein D3C87_410680 [compost metagenome]
MKPSKVFVLGCLSSFFIGWAMLSLVAWYSEFYLPADNCSWYREISSKSEVEYQRVSALFWVRSCNVRNVMIGSSEATGSHALPFFVRQNGYKFDQFIGAHRGLKTLGYLMAHQVSQQRIDHLKILAFVNPIYYTTGPASTDIAMAYRSALSVRFMNRFVPNGTTGAQENIFEFLYVIAKGFFLDSLELWRSVTAEISDFDKGDFKATTPLEYDVEKGLYSKFVGREFKSDINFYIEPTHTFSRIIKENKNRIKTCLVLLPLNERYFLSQNPKYKEQISMFYDLYKNYFSGVGIIDLTDMGKTPYLFADTMHFTEYGSSQIIDRVVSSSCFKKLWGSPQ